MTTELRVYADRLPLRSTTKAIHYKPSISTMLLGLLVILSGLAVIYVADLNRRLFMDMQETQAYQVQLQLDWDKLLLEQSTWSTQARIQNLAQERLGMTTPANNQIMTINET